MVNLMFTYFFGTLFCYAMTVFSIGFIFLLRALIMIFFECDMGIWVIECAQKISDWFKKMKAKSARRKQIRQLKKDIAEAESRETWVIEDDKDETKNIQ